MRRPNEGQRRILLSTHNRRVKYLGIFLILVLLPSIQFYGLSAPACGVPQEIFIVKERVEVTSDWSELKWVNGPIILTNRYEVLEGEAALKDIQVMGLNVYILKHSYDATRVVVEVEAIIMRGQDQGLLSLYKGDIGRTTVSLQAYSPAAASFRDVFTFWREMTPPFSIDVDVSSAYEERCSTVSFQDAIPSIKGKVFSFYYAWYGNPEGPTGYWEHWQGVTREDIRNSDNYPLLGPYDSNDVGVIRAHMLMAKQAGIDGFIVSWWGITPLERQIMNKILAVASEVGFTISIYYEPVRELTQQMIIDELSYVVRTYGGSQAFMKDQGRPVIFVYVPLYDGRDSQFWVDVRRSVEDSVGSIVLVGDHDQLGVDLSEAFDGFHNYIYLGNDPQGYYSDAIGRMAVGRPRSVGEAFTHAYAGQSVTYYNKPFLVTVSPGFNSTDWNPDGPQVSRENGQRYTRFWEAAIDLQAYTVLLTSWNEWHEGTELEPSREHGFKYLDLTRNFVSEYKEEIVSTPRGGYEAVLKELRLVTESRVTGMVEVTVERGSPAVIVSVKAAALSGVRDMEIDYGVPSYYYLKQTTLTEAVIPSIRENLPIEFDIESEGMGVLVSVDVTAYDPSGREYVVFRGVVPAEEQTFRLSKTIEEQGATLSDLETQLENEQKAAQDQKRQLELEIANQKKETADLRNLNYMMAGACVLLLAATVLTIGRSKRLHAQRLENIRARENK